MILTDVEYVIIWILFLTFIQIGVYLIISIFFPKFAVPISFTLSILLLGLISWYLVLFQLMIQLTLIFFCGIMLIGIIALRKNLKDILLKIAPYYLLFISFFLVLLCIRYLIPDNIGAEFFMDFGIIHSMYRYPVMPPVDLWYGGEPLNVYYYYGFWLLSAPGIILKIPPSILYTLALPSVFAYSAINLYVIGEVLLKKYKYIMVLILLIPIPAIIYYLCLGINGPEIFSNSIFLIPGTATEWAQASFLKSDVHPHTISIMVQTFFIFLLLITIKFYRFWSKIEKIFIATITSLCLGSFVPLNTWSVIVYAPLILITGLILIFDIYKNNDYNTVGLSSFAKSKDLSIRIKHVLHSFVDRVAEKKRTFLLFFIYIPILSILIYLPYYLQSKGQILYPSLVTTPSPITPFLLFWGFFFIVIFCYYYYEIKKFPWILILLIPGIALGYGVAAISGILMIYALMRRKNIIDLLNFWGLFLLCICEIIYLVDNLVDAAYRFNTVFKVYSAVWIILGVSSSIIVGKYLEEHIFQTRHKSIIEYIPLFCIIMLLFSLIPFALFIFPSDTTPSLRSDNFLKNTLPQDYDGIIFLRNLTGAHLLIEGSNFRGDFTHQGRVSVFSGIPSVLGQYLHENLWRGPVSGTNEIISRALMIQVIYEKPDLSLYMVDHLGADLVYVGPLERSLYNVSLPSEGFDMIYNDNGVTILKRNNYPAPIPNSFDTSIMVDIPNLTEYNYEAKNRYQAF